MLVTANVANVGADDPKGWNCIGCGLPTKVFELDCANCFPNARFRVPTVGAEPSHPTIARSQAIASSTDPPRHANPTLRVRKARRKLMKGAAYATLSWRRAPHVQSESIGSPVVDKRVWRRVLSGLPQSTPPWDRRVNLREEPEYLELQATARDLNARTISGTRQRRLSVIRDVMRAHGIPAHADFIGAIVMDLLPGLFESTFGVRRFLEWHPEEFQSEGDGVYSLMSDFEIEPAEIDELMEEDSLEVYPESLSAAQPIEGMEELRED